MTNELIWESAGTDEVGDQNATARTFHGYFQIGPTNTGEWSVMVMTQDNNGLLRDENHVGDYDSEAEAKHAVALADRTADEVFGPTERGNDIHLAEKCAHCHLFIEANDSYEPGDDDIAEYVHLTRGDEADELIDGSHDAASSGLLATLDTWKQFGPLAMRQRFTDYDEATQPTVTTLVIEHEYGNDVFLFPTEAAAIEHLDGFVKEWWEDEIGDDIPTDSDQRITYYFEHAQNDGYIMETKIAP